jgi:PAS domain S-box-containing protein
MLMDIESSLDIDNASSVDEAFKKLTTGNYDIVVSDYEMPQKDGLEFLKKLREQKNKIPFILFTGKGREEVAIRALNLGVDGYFNKQGSPETVYGELCYGITQTVDHKRDEEALRKSEHLNQKILNSTPNLIYIYDIEEKRNIYSNREIVDFLGYTQVQIATMGSELFSNILHPDDANAVDAYHARFINAPDNVAYNVEFRMKHANGEWRWLRSQDTLFSRNKQGLGKQILGICQDVTLNKQNETALKNSEEQYRAYTENSPVAFFVVSSEGKYIQVNNAATKLLLYSKNELLKMSIVDILFEKDMSLGLKQFATLRETGESRFEIALKRKDGEPVYVILNAIRLPDGNMMAFCENITEQKKTESELKIERNALRQSEAKLSSIVENSTDQIFMLDENLTYLSVNKTLGDILGKTPQEIIGKSVNEIYPQETASKFSNNIKNVFETGKSMFMEEKMVAQGHELFISTSLNPVQDDKGKVIAVTGIVRDITERKKAEEAIKFEADLLNQVGQAVIMVDNNKIIRFWNKVAEKLYGYSEEQALGHNVTALLGVASPKETDEVSRRLMAGESWSTETSAKNKDGSVVPVILNRTPIFKEDGEFSGVASITTEITLQKRTEADLTFSLESLSNSLSKIQELNEKLRVVGDLTRHDVRNKLSAVTGYAYILKKKHADEADVVDGLVRMEQAVKDSMKIFDFAKLYEQLGIEELTTVDVEAKINQAKALFSGSLPNIINECHGLTVLADSFLRQMFYNLIDNTRKYGQKTSIIRVHYKKTDQGNLELIYEDDGVGISAENKLKLFSEGFSTGGGTGFGLFLTKKMMDVYGWEIEENGEPGKGAKFIITIPKLSKNGKENYQTV